VPTPDLAPLVPLGGAQQLQWQQQLAAFVTKRAYKIQIHNLALQDLQAGS